MVLQQLSPDRYEIHQLQAKSDFFAFVEQEKQHLDCLILENNGELPHLANWLHGQATLLPAILISPKAEQEGKPPHDRHPDEDQPDALQTTDDAPFEESFIYHTAEICFTLTQPESLGQTIEQAIAQFLKLSPTCRLNNVTDLATDLTTQNFLLLQQRRLSEKLKERLGYLGVYYKRNPKNFFRHLAPEQKQEVLQELQADYRDIVLRYFRDDQTLNELIDNFVNAAFFTDISVSQVVEIHMDLMDEFSKQLKLEGRSEEILLDYRLTLIDIIAHLCEMYRRSIPRTD